MPLRIVAADKPKRKGRSFRNTRRENREEELGRVDAEKAYTSRGKRNLRDEKHRIRSELAVGGAVGSALRRKTKGKGEKLIKAEKMVKEYVLSHPKTERRLGVTTAVITKVILRGNP